MARRDRNKITTELEITTPKQWFWVLQQLAEGKMTIRLLSEVRADALRTFPTGAPKATIPVSELHRVLDDMMDSLADKTANVTDGTTPTLTLPEIKTRIREFMPVNNQQLIDEEKFRDWWGLLITNLQAILSNKSSSFVPSLATTLTNLATRFADNGSGSITPANLHQTVLDVTYAVEDLVDGGVIVTAPPTVTLTSPSNNATVPVGALTLTWTSTDATTFDVYWGPVGAAVLVANDIVTQSVGVTAVEGRADEWRVEATGPGGTVSSKTCNFTGQPGPIVNLSTPADAATGLTNPVTLTWTASNANLFDVTAGETGSEVTVFTDIPNQPAQLSGLADGVQHRWKVKAKGLQGAADVETPFRTFTMTSTVFPPEPVGWAKDTTVNGARGAVSPVVMQVTNLNDTGAGSLRAAWETPGALIIPMVDGTVFINSPINVASNTTFLGHAAPGSGIAMASTTTMANNFDSFLNLAGKSNIIIRHMRFRYTDTLANGWKDTPTGNGGAPIVMTNTNKFWFDHLSSSFGTDGSLFNMGAYGGDQIRNGTISHCFMYYPIYLDRKNWLIDGDIGNLTVYKCVLAANADRAPNFSGHFATTALEWVGNVHAEGANAFYSQANNTAHEARSNVIGSVRLINTGYEGYATSGFDPNLVEAKGFGGDPTRQVKPKFFVKGCLDSSRTAQSQAQNLAVNPTSHGNMLSVPVLPSSLENGDEYAAAIADTGDDAVDYATRVLAICGSRSGNALDSLDEAVRVGILDRVSLTALGAAGQRPRISEPSQVGGIPTMTTGSPPIVTPQANWNQIGAGGFLIGELEVQAVRNV